MSFKIKASGFMLALTLVGLITACTSTAPATSTTVRSATATLKPSRTPTPKAMPTQTSTLSATTTRQPTTTSATSPKPTATSKVTATATISPTATITATVVLSPSRIVSQPIVQPGMENVQAPPGFKVNHISTVEHPTNLTFGPEGRLYVAQQEGNIYVIDEFGQPQIYASGFTLPIGMAFKPGTQDMFVASRSAAHNAGYLSLVKADGTIEHLISDLPCCYTPVYHQPNSLVIGPDGLLYMSIGARSDHGEASAENFAEPGELHPLEAGILQIDPNTLKVEKYASGLRNPYDLAFSASGNLYAIDNGQDYGPGDELNLIEAGKHYGWPYEPCQICFAPPEGLLWEAPLIAFPNHSAPTGLTAYSGAQFPADYTNTLLIAFFTKNEVTEGVMRVDPLSGQLSPFINGLHAPVDVVQAPDGSIFIADWPTGNIIQVIYTGQP